jgi:hypothetical protein
MTSYESKARELKSGYQTPPLQRQRDSDPASGQHTEGTVAKAIEAQTAKLPSDTFLWAAGASIAASLLLQLMGKKEASAFVGQWAPTVLILGVYNKLVKVVGSDSLSGTAN